MANKKSTSINKALWIRVETTYTIGLMDLRPVANRERAAHTIGNGLVNGNV